MFKKSIIYIWNVQTLKQQSGPQSSNSANNFDNELLILINSE